MPSNILEFIEHHRGTRTRNAITDSLLLAGHSAEEIEAAWLGLGAEPAPVQPPTGWLPRQAGLPTPTILALVSSLAAVTVSLAPALTFPWQGPTADQGQAAGPTLLAVGLVVVLSFIGLLLAATGVASLSAGGPSTTGTRTPGRAVFGLAVVVLIAAVLQGFTYICSMAFIGG